MFARALVFITLISIGTSHFQQQKISSKLQIVVFCYQSLYFVFSTTTQIFYEKPFKPNLSNESASQWIYQKRDLRILNKSRLGHFEYFDWSTIFWFYLSSFVLSERLRSIYWKLCFLTDHYRSKAGVEDPHSLLDWVCVSKRDLYCL